MANRRKVPSARQTRRMSRDIRDSTIGTHVERDRTPQRRSAGSASTRAGRHASAGRVESVRMTASSMGENRSPRRTRTYQRPYIETAKRRSDKRRLGLVVGVVAVIAAVAVLAGFLAFRGSVGSEMALRDSDASQALVPVRSDEPYYALITAELGAVAEPLEHAGPDILFLARIDREKKTVALVSIPSGLQVSTDTGSHRIADLAEQGDAALIDALSNFAKVNISHYVKIAKGGIEAIVEDVGGVDVDVDQIVDDPHAGDVYLPAGAYTLNGAAALTYLRADNLRLGVADQLQHQVDFGALLLSKFFSAEGNFATRLDRLDTFIQTDLSLGDIEALQSWMRDLPASSIARTVIPGYLTEVTGVVDTGDALYICSSGDMADIIEALESGETIDMTSSSDIVPADPASFTVEVQNGTSIVGAAAVTGDSLTAAGFNVAKVGNAEQPVYDETLVVYKSAEGQGIGRAKAVINTLGVGRAVEGDIYYKFDPDVDVLVIVGADYKPFA